MKKLLRTKDILLLTLAGIGDIAEEVKDPMHIWSSSYKSMYGFIPKRYKKSNFAQMVNRNLKTGDIEKIVKDGKTYLRLSSRGTTKIHRDFPIINLTKKWNKRWIIVIFDIEERSKNIRDRFRFKLKSLGFGMLQKSIWITPMSIEKDLKEFVESIGLSKNVYVMEVSGFLFGNPKELVRKVWNLDKLEEEYSDLKNRADSAKQLLIEIRGRENKREAEMTNMASTVNIMANITSRRINYADKKKRETMGEYLRFIANFPAIPKELLPDSLKNYFCKILLP